MKKILSIFIISLLSACSGTSGGPKTISKGDLNPPFNLISVTQTDSMMLEWRISNTEDNIVGYNVYVVPKTVAQLQALLSTEVKEKYNIATQQIRRCDGTKALFSVFGFDPEAKQATQDCDDFSETEEAANTKTGTTEEISGANLADEEEIVSKFVPCYTCEWDADTQSCDSPKSIGSSTLSIDITKAKDNLGKTLGEKPTDRVGKTLRCVIPDTVDGAQTALSDGSKGFSNGVNYSAFVVAVAGDKAEKMSYTSNFVEDSPTTYTKHDFTLAAGKAKSITFDATSGTPVGTSTLATSASTCGTGGLVCTLFYENDFSTAGQVWVMVDTQASSERIFVSGTNMGGNGTTYLAKRDPRSYRDADYSGVFTPGDAPLTYTSGQYLSEKNQVAYPGDLFDVAYKVGSSYHYGKLYIDTFTTSGGTKTLRVWTAMSNVADSAFYNIESALNFK